jgi:hypothetical protein
MRTKATLAERFEQKTIPEPNSGCLLWLGSNRPPAGYGVIRENGKLIPATHIALRLDGRPVPADMQALHTCDNPYCVQASHLFVGDQQANVDDMLRKGRRKSSNFWRDHPHLLAEGVPSA